MIRHERNRQLCVSAPYMLAQESAYERCTSQLECCTVDIERAAWSG